MFQVYFKVLNLCLTVCNISMVFDHKHGLHQKAIQQRSQGEQHSPLHSL